MGQQRGVLVGELQSSTYDQLNLITIIDSVFQQDGDMRYKIRGLSRLAYLYLYYHYYGADITSLSDIDDLIVDDSGDSTKIKSVLPSCTADGDVFDFIFAIDEQFYLDNFSEKLEDTLKTLSEEVGRVVLHRPNQYSISDVIAMNLFDTYSIKNPDEVYYAVRIITDAIVPVEEKIAIQAKVAAFTVENKAVSFEILFGDDLQQEVSDVESPKEFVSSGELILSSPDSVCYFGDEKSFVSLVSAKSLKDLFLKYGTHGLFASNLRFFINSKKIDPKITNTIQNEPDNFAYYNNGIIVTCDDYKIVGNTVLFTNFSIVNGGQTTNLIGRTQFDHDFSVVAKVIKNKYANIEDRVNFLSKVAEASNTQKPINAKDLIANRVEQRMLKLQYAGAGMFLKVKRGEKIDKSKYSEPWMNASNDEVAQMLYSYVYQCPGVSKNSKSKILSNDKTYSMIFETKYDDNFLKSIQFLKIAFNSYQKHIKLAENYASEKNGLTRHANFYADALIGFLFKLITNPELRVKVFQIPVGNFSNANSDLIFLLRQNDIGTISLIKPDQFSAIGKTTFFQLFDFILDHILVPAYDIYKTSMPNSGYADFFKSDKYYYGYVLRKAVMVVRNESSDIVLLMQDMFNLTGKTNVEFVATKKFDEYKPGVREELTEFRSKMVDDAKGRGAKIKVSDVIKLDQIEMIGRLFPRTLEELQTKIGMSEDQIRDYGGDILKIINKYADVSSFK
jgi:hypothetical protein